MGDPLTLSGCRELQELEIYALCPSNAELNLISSITSTNIRRIAFTRPTDPLNPPASDDPHWSRLDNCLCRLIDQQESGRRLDAEFLALNVQPQWGWEVAFKEFLPRFYEKGGGGGGRGR